MTNTKAMFTAMLRRDFYSFIARSFDELHPETAFQGNWHIELMAAALEDCRQGRTRRLIITVPPRSLKSHTASVAFVAWLLGHNPAAQVICASYAQDLADKHALDTRTLMRSRFYEETFATRMSPLKQTLGEFMTTGGGVRMATSVGGVLTGRGADYILIDDPLKPDEALSETQRKAVNTWFDNTVISRLNDKTKGCIILIAQRLHEDDLIGHVQEHGDWKVLRFPAIAEEREEYLVPGPLDRSFTQVREVGEALHPEREPIEALKELRQVLGEYNFAGQYQQAPAPLDGGMVKRAWFKTYTDATKPQRFEQILQSWDTANKATELNDYSVCTTWGISEKRFYLLHVLRQRLEYPELKRLVRTHALQFSAKTVLIEDKASGTQLIQDLIREHFYPVKRYKPELDKILRLHSVTAVIENGFVYLPEKADWLGVYLHELTTFPNAKFDDQADSTSQALDWAKVGSGYVFGLVEYLKRQEAKQYSTVGHIHPGQIRRL